MLPIPLTPRLDHAVLALFATALLALTPWSSVGAQTPAGPRRLGGAYEITLTRVTETQGGGSSGSSHDVDSIVERVVGLRPDGVDLEYDLPKSVAPEERAGNWEFPARVSAPDHGPLTLINEPELQARLDPWLQAAGLSRSDCGQWIFTWNAFRIECDPQSVLGMIEAFRAASATLRTGDSYRDPDAARPGPLVRTTAGPAGTTFSVDLAVDPQGVRQGRARSDVVVAQLMRKPTTLDAALRARADEKITGTILITFDTDPAGQIRRRTKVMKLLITTPAGRAERKTITETVERRRILEP